LTNAVRVEGRRRFVAGERMPGARQREGKTLGHEGEEAAVDARIHEAIVAESRSVRIVR